MGEDLDRLTSEASPERRGFSDDYLRGLHASAPAATLLRTMAMRSPSRPPLATWARSSATRTFVYPSLGSVGTLFTGVRGRGILRSCVSPSNPSHRAR